MTTRTALQKPLAAIAAAVLLLLLACEEMPAPGAEPDPPAPPARNDLNPPVWILGTWSSCTPVPGGVEVEEDSTWWLFTADSVQSATYRFGLEDYEIDYTDPAYTVTDANLSPSRYEITGAVPDRHGNIVMVRHTFYSISTYRASVSSEINGRRLYLLLCLQSRLVGGMPRIHG